MKTLVFGNGWLGSMLCDCLKGSMSDCDIIDEREVARVVQGLRPDVVINAAGKCGEPNVDWCAATRDNRRLTFHTNAIGPAIVEKVCKDNGVRQFVHLSSGCMWKEGTNITEDTPFDSPSYYIDTKAEGERRLDKSYALILRFRMPFNSDITASRNLITKLLKYKQLIDEPNSVVYTGDFLTAARFLVVKGCRGVYHVVNRGGISPKSVMGLYQRYVDPKHVVATISYEQLLSRGLVTSGRSNITLSVEKLEREGCPMPEAESRVVQVMKEISVRDPAVHTDDRV